MKKTLTVLYSALCLLQSTLLFVIPTVGGISTAFAQGSGDSVRITHTQEVGTLEKQEFVSKYDYVFMTHEPASLLLKFAPSYSSGGFTSLQYGLEKKLGKKWSIGASGYLGDMSQRSRGSVFWGELEPRFYFKNKRHTTNNLNGTYVSAFVQLPLFPSLKDTTSSFAYRNSKTVGIALGWQRRIGTSFFADISLKTGFHTIQKGECSSGNCEQITYGATSHTPFFMTNVRIGLGSTFTKGRLNAPDMCVLTQCDEKIRQLWKIDLLRLLQLDRYYRSSFLNVEYERSIILGWSIGATLGFKTEYFSGIHSQYVDKKYIYSSVQSHFLSTIASLQSRYYLSIRKQNESNLLSGPYVCLGISKEHTFSGINPYLNNPLFIHTGYGVQHKIAEHLFFNAQAMIGPRIEPTKTVLAFSTSMQLGFAL